MSATTIEDTASLCVPTPQAAISTAPAILNAIRDESCNLALWQRRPVTDWSALLGGAPSEIRFAASRNGLAPRIVAALASNGFGASHLHRALADDVDLLAGLFCAALGIEDFDLRLEVVTTDSCRKFHADYVAARLITTYVGPGTQWLSQEDAERARPEEVPARINRLESGDVGIFKGRRASEHPAIHRSPPIAAGGEKRLLLVLNRTEPA